MSNYALVVDADKQPCTPVPPGTARLLLSKGEAAVFRKFPFTIILKNKPEMATRSLHLKIDPGSKVTGLAVLDGDRVIWAAELEHRGQQIKSALEGRSAVRRNRRSRKTRYRKARFLNRKRAKKWLAPSLQHRSNTIMTWVERLRRLAPIAAISQELVRFDLQKIENPEVSGIEYQQGTLQGYEVREYLLEKWGRVCAYCGAKNIKPEVEHIIPRSKGGSDRISNLTIACHDCNQKKDDKPIQEFLSKKPSVLKAILAQAKRPLKDAAAVNSTRWALFERLKGTGLPLECGSGGKTKYNRTRLGLPKTHWLDAACVGDVDTLTICTTQPLLIKCDGWGSRQMCNLGNIKPDPNSKRSNLLVRKKNRVLLILKRKRREKEGAKKGSFPIAHRTRQKVHFGFQTGDMAIARIPKGKYAGTYTGRVTVRASGAFSLKVGKQKIGVNHKYLTAIHRKDGYSYRFACSSLK